MTRLEDAKQTLMLGNKLMSSARDIAKDGWERYRNAVIDEVLDGNVHMVIERQEILRGMTCSGKDSPEALLVDVQWWLNHRWRERAQAHPSETAPYRVTTTVVNQLADFSGHTVIVFEEVVTARR